MRAVEMLKSRWLALRLVAQTGRVALMIGLSQASQARALPATLTWESPWLSSGHSVFFCRNQGSKESGMQKWSEAVRTGAGVGYKEAKLVFTNLVTRDHNFLFPFHL